MNMQREEEILKAPPQAIEAEQSVLGSMMLDNRVIDGIKYLVGSEDFYLADHRLIFDTVCKLDERGEAADVVTVSEALQDNQAFHRAGGLRYLGEIAKNTPNTGNIKSYAKLVRQKAVLRRVIETANDAIQSAYQAEGRSVTDIVDSYAESANAISLSRHQSNNRPIKEVLESKIQSIEEKYKLGDKIIGLSTGLIDIDHKINGLQGGKLYVIAGRPSMGKTAFAMNFCETICANKGVAQVFTLEMPAEEITGRMMASLGPIDYSRINSPALIQDTDWPKLTSAVGLMDGFKMFIEDSNNVTLEHIRTTCRQVQREHGLDVLMVDYLQLMKFPKADRVDLSVGMITKSLKGLAKELDIPVLLLSQLNRSLEQRPNKRPVMSDLRESGSIEQDADVIMLLYRDEYYNTESDMRGIAEVIHAKNRAGLRGVTTRLVFRGQHQRFENYSSLTPPGRTQ